MKVVVTGASGFIGHNVLLRAPRDWEIVAVYHSTPGLEAFVDAAWADQRPSGALRSAERGRRAGAGADDRRQAGRDAVSRRQRRSGGVGRAAALGSRIEHRSPSSPASNTVPPITWCIVSSGAVYDGLSGAVSPATPVSPRLPYAISKLASEQYLRFFAEHRGSVSSYVNVRFFGAYGPYEAARKITTRWLQALAAGQREFVDPRRRPEPDRLHVRGRCGGWVSGAGQGARRAS